MDRYPSGQREQTVNLLACAFGGSNPSLSIVAGITQLVESLPSKQVVAGSSPVSRSNLSLGVFLNIAGWSSPVARRAHNPEVVGSNPAPAIFLPM